MNFYDRCVLADLVDAMNDDLPLIRRGMALGSAKEMVALACSDGDIKREDLRNIYDAINDLGYRIQNEYDGY